jgi:hypothetical protein
MKKTTVKKSKKVSSSGNVKMTSHIEDMESYNKTKKPIKYQFPFDVKFFTGSINHYLVYRFGSGRNTSFGVFVPTYQSDTCIDIDPKLFEKMKKNSVSFFKEIWDKPKYYSEVKLRKPRVKRPHGSTKQRRKRKVS